MAPSKRFLSLTLALGLLLAGARARADDTSDRSTSDGTTSKRALTPQELAAFIDGSIQAKLDQESIEAAPLISDEGFLRRASLDIRGAPPSPEEVLAFVKDKDSKKREKSVMSMLKDEGYADHWSDLWNRALIGRSTTTRRFVGVLFNTWLKDVLAENKPYDQMVKDIIAAEGYVDENGANAYVLRFEAKAPELAAATAKHFMGVQIECAQCHDHPYTDYKQQDFWGMAGYFGRVAQRRERQMNGRRRFSVRERRRGVLKVNANFDPVKPNEWGKSISPDFIVAKLSEPKSENFRKNYADLITDSKNPYFAKMGVNRIWSILFGSGLVNPIDDLQQGETLHPKMLTALGEQFRNAKYDLQWLIAGIIMSKTYQRDSKRTRGQEDLAAKAKKARKSSNDEKRELAAQRAILERRLFARSELRPLSPEQIFRSMMQANGLNEIRVLRRRQGFKRRMRGVVRLFTFAFDNGGDSGVEEFNGTIPQSLLMMNSRFVTQSIESQLGAIHQIVKKYSNPKVRLQRIFLRILSRLPDSGETRMYMSHIKSQKNTTKAYEDIAWVLINSSEFVFNH